MRLMDAFTEPDPAERSVFNRLFYRNRRPTSVGHWVSRFFCWWARVGPPPRAWVVLEVRDRVSGRICADAVVLPTGAGHQYVVSARLSTEGVGAPTPQEVLHLRGHHAARRAEGPAFREMHAESAVPPFTRIGLPCAMPFTAYLSFTLKDLEPERRAVQDALGDQCVVVDSYRASEGALIESCLDEVAACAFLC
jgi:hypothetical protein